jgi:uncharacterized protein
VNMAHRIYDESDDTFKSTLDLRTIHLAALLHDVGDRKSVIPVPEVVDVEKRTTNPL